MCFASEWNHNFRGSTRMCSVCSCEKRTRAPMWATSGWCLFQSQYFLVLIHSRVPVVHQCGQPRTGAHGVLICQDVTSSGPEGKRKGGWGESLDGEKERWHPHVRTHAPVQKTHRACLSVNQSMSTWETQLLPFISPKTSQHSSLSPLAVLHATLVQYNWEFVALGGRLVRKTCFISRRDQLKCHFDIFNWD